MDCELGHYGEEQDKRGAEPDSLHGSTPTISFSDEMRGQEYTGIEHVACIGCKAKDGNELGAEYADEDEIRDNRPEKPICAAASGEGDEENINKCRDDE